MKFVGPKDKKVLRTSSKIFVGAVLAVNILFLVLVIFLVFTFLAAKRNNNHGKARAETAFQAAKLKCGGVDPYVVVVDNPSFEPNEYDYSAYAPGSPSYADMHAVYDDGLGGITKVDSYYCTLDQLKAAAASNPYTYLTLQSKDGNIALVNKND
ncbi:MAG TPA: hypothetical protein VLG13_03075 [Patescibacteria group bacterium]|nr:hypothetical protein [Patescibacteria group bacterium]